MTVWLLSLILGYTAGLLTALLVLCWNYSRWWPRLDREGSVLDAAASSGETPPATGDA